jgi:4-amino-4-deoxy-L-arabinose transferase-like glycosyltransferase
MAADKLSKKWFLFLLGLVICLNATCLFNEILEPDGTLYAGLAKEIFKTGNWLFLWANGADWLDKPHLPFWLAAISFKIFGISAFAYKLPSFILFIVSLGYCYRITAVVYSKEIARLATLIYGTSLHIIISNFDGKVEIHLTAFAIAAIYHLYCALEQKWFWHIVAAALFSACAVMTKGIFSLLTIGAGFVIYWIKTKQWKEFINPKWYIFVLLVLIFEKTHVSGLRFFFWDSQFGRFFNNGPIKGKGDLSFFLHTTLWAFLPWSVLLLLALVKLFNRPKKPVDYKRWIIGASALFSFVMFSLSKFQLPHYILILFPHFSIITAAWLFEGVSENVLKKINVFQTVLFALVVVAITGLIFIYSFEQVGWFLIILPIIATIIFFYKPGNALLAILKKNTGIALLIAIFLNCLLYPSILKYQAGMMAGKWLNTQIASIPKVSLYKSQSSGFDFYYNGKTDYSFFSPPKINSISGKDSVILFSALHDLEDVNKDSVNINILKNFQYFHVSQLSGKFINFKTRQSVLDTFVIALVTPKPGRK